MKGNYCEKFDAVFEELEKVYPNYDIVGARHFKDEDGFFPYFFNIKEHKHKFLPETLIVYEPDLEEACIATFSDGVLEKMMVNFFEDRGVKCKLVKNIEEGSLEILKIPFQRLKDIESNC